MTVACVLRSGGGFTTDDVDALHRAFLRYDPGVDFVCLSDVPVRCRWISLSTDLPGWWAKMELFRPGLFTGERVLYIDLDTVVVGDPRVLAFGSISPIVLSDFYDPANMASGVVAFTGGDPWIESIWNDFRDRAPTIMAQHPRRMDHYLRGYLNAARRWQVVAPGAIVSYKEHLRGRREPYAETIEIPADARLVCMHGRPTLRELPADDPVRKAWGR